jgi:hypothetical protein
MRQYWRIVMESFPCKECNAAPGEPCYTKSGNQKTECHAVRWADAERCHKCGERLPADYDPGELCDRCKLIRRLEIERATTWQRRY